MNISYVNFYNESITEQQSSLVPDYSKIYKDPNTNNIKIKKKFYNFKQSCVKYYKDINETFNQILSEYNNIVGTLEIIETEYLGNYRLEKESCYSDGILYVKGNALYIGDDEKYIGSETIDKDTGIPLYERTIKYYYDTQWSVNDPIFEVYYNENDGSLNYLRFNIDSKIFPYVDEEHYGLESIQDGSWEQLRLSLEIPLDRMNYYKTSNVIP